MNDERWTRAGLPEFQIIAFDFLAFALAAMDTTWCYGYLSILIRKFRDCNICYLNDVPALLSVYCYNNTRLLS